ncbi:MAG: DUF1049 domain-containing protein [Candidatus Zixiibacteriota bacterium]|nr:MAG: DUF1049 domain-containing protein [candidate division Zixibacteria bacterium]
MFTGKQIVTIVLTGLILIILIQNSNAVPLKFLLLSFSLPLSVLVFVVVLVGVLIGHWLNRRKSNAPKR